MNVINLKVDFEKRTIRQTGVNLTSGDYNSTKLVFEFDKEYEETKICEIAKKEDTEGNNESIFAEEVLNNEVVLVGYADVTDEDGNIKYQDSSENVYWYDEDNEVLYDSSYNVSSVSLSTLTKILQEVSIFDEPGKYVLEVCLYGNNSKLTSISTDLKVKGEMVKVGDAKVTQYLPVFDTLMNIANELISDLEEADTTMTTNEATRQANEETRQTNETTRQSNETTRQSNETTRQSNESSRTSAETTRASNETSRISAETSRASAETSRASAETSRASAESTRETNETSRVSAESSRATAETARASAESSRASAETTRASNETSRQNAENTRDSNETTRQSNESSRSSAETSRASAESSRASAETSRASAESTRISNETTRQSNEETRQTNEAAREVRMAALEDKMEEIDKTRGHVYGVKRKISSNSSSSWTSTDDAVGLVANATKNGGTVQNDFDKLSPWKDIISFNLDLTTGRKKAYYGDPDFKFDGSNGDVYTHIPDIYYKVWQEDDYDYIQIADYAKTGFTKCNAFDIQRYHTGLVDNVLHSYSGLVPAYNKSIVSFRTAAEALGNDYCLMDWRYFIIQLLYLVEYADYNTQSKLGNGLSNMRFNNSDVSLLAESNTNRFVVNTSGGSSFIVGQTISIGTSSRENFGVAANRKITAITDYNENGIEGKEITFDGEAVDIALTNVIWSSAQHSGGCDSLGMKSGCLADDNKHAMIYRGIENWFGNIFQWVDGINIKDYQAYICYDPSEYESDKFTSPYKELGYVNCDTEGYAKTLGFDINDPLVRFPVEIGGGTSSYMCDYYYKNTGNRVARVGGPLSNGTYDGAWSWFWFNGSSSAYWNVGARVLKYQ